jgi:hypothetical protein
VIDYKVLRERNSAALATLKAEQVAYRETHPELLLSRPLPKKIERSALDVPMIFKRNDRSLIGPSEATAGDE